MLKQPTVTDKYLLKTATRRLITACGGVEGAASLTRVGKTVLSDYGNATRTDHFMPLDVVVDLTADTGVTAVIEAMAALSGGVFIPAKSLRRDMSLSQAVADFMAESADVLKSVSVSMRDGRLTMREKQDIVRQIEQVIAACTMTMSALDSGDAETNGDGHGK